MARLFTPLTAKILPVALLLLVALVSMPAESATKKKAIPKGTGNPFVQLNGYWTGGGTVIPPKGQAEKVSCRVTYSVAARSFRRRARPRR